MNSVSVRAASLLAAVTLSLTACTATPAASSAPGNTEVAKGGSQFSEAGKVTSELGSDAAAGVFPRTVKHANGTTEIKTKPVRVVAMDTGEIDDLVSLGITPVGVATTEGQTPVPEYLSAKVSGAKQVGSVSEPNLEAIAALKPDLIISSKLRHDKLYAQLSQIAPTVFSVRPGYTWKENFSLVADALGEETKGEQVMNDYKSAVADLKASKKGDPTVSLVRFMPGKLRLYAKKSLIGTILDDAGIKRPTNQSIDDLATEISPENISQADADIVFYTSYGDPAATGETKVINGAAWKQIPAVAAGKAYRVHDDVWFLGLGPTGAMQIVSDLKAQLTK